MKYFNFIFIHNVQTKFLLNSKTIVTYNCFLLSKTIVILKLQGHVFFIDTQQKNAATFFLENVTCGAYLQHAAILDFYSKKMLQHFFSKIKSVCYCCNSFATFLIFCSTIFLSAAYFLVAHMCSISLQQILL